MLYAKRARLLQFVFAGVDVESLAKLRPIHVSDVLRGKRKVKLFVEKVF
jgi:hypothetical protein